MSDVSDFYAAMNAKQSELEDVLSDAPKGPGVVVGRIWKEQVADGYAFYRVTKVNKRTIRYEWLEMGFDPYVSRTLGRSGSLPLSTAERIFDSQDRINALFGIAQ